MAVSVDFRLLGPLEIVVDGQPRPLGSPAEKAVLAVLLLAAGRTVPRESLVDALWGEAPPNNPANAVQGRISRLRRALTDIGLSDRLIVAHGPGYVAAVDPGQVDAHRFTSLIQQARAAAGDSPTAAGLYAEALALWRGPALADFASQPWAMAEMTHLEELRLAAIEERISLELDRGRHSELVDELEQLATSNPLRERVHGQLMLALYRCGRQADALAAYRRLQQTLDDQLGLDPSTDLRDLEQAILRQDARLGAPARDLPGPLTNLPVRVTSFVGRERQLTQLSELLGAHRLVTLTGPGGAGKTSLALQAAGAAAERYPDGVWLVRLAGVGSPAAVAEVVAESVGAQRPAGGVVDSLVGFLRNRSAMVVLDNCEHLIDACAELAERLVTSGARLRLLVTSREPLRVPGEVQLAVPPLACPPPDITLERLRDYDAARLFLDRALSIQPDLLLDAATAADVGRICRQLDGLPLALELAAARVASLTIADLAARLDDRFRLLTGGARTAEARQKTLRATVDWSHQLLTSSERVLFRRLSVFRGGWTLEAATAVVTDELLPAEAVLDLSAALVDRSLVLAETGQPGGRFRMLETLRQYATERAERGRRDRAARRSPRPVLRGPGRDRPDPAARSGAGPLAAAAASGAAQHRCRPALDTTAARHDDLGLRLVAALGWFWYFTSNQNAVAQIEEMLHRHADASPAARAHAVQAKSIVARPGSCIVHPSPVCGAAARQSLEELDLLGEQGPAAYSRALLAVEAIAGPLQPPAQELLAAARAAFHDAGDRWGLALTLFVEMELQFAAGQLESGRRTFQQALELFRELGDHWGISAVQYHLGMALHRAGQLTEALDVYRAALSEGRIGLTNTVQYALANLGHISLLIGDLDGADAYFTSAHAVARELGAEASPLALLGQGHLARLRDQADAAAAHYTAALEQLVPAETPDWAAIAHNGLAHLAHQRGDSTTARRHYREAWTVGHRRGDPASPSRRCRTRGSRRRSRRPRPPPHRPALPRHRRQLANNPGLAPVTT